MAVPAEWQAVLDILQAAAPVYKWPLNVWRIEQPAAGSRRMRAVTHAIHSRTAMSEADEKAAEQQLGFAAAPAGRLLCELSPAALTVIPSSVMADIRSEPIDELKWLFAVPYILGIRPKKMTGFTESREIAPNEEIEFRMENAFLASAAAIQRLFQAHRAASSKVVRGEEVDKTGADALSSSDYAVLQFIVNSHPKPQTLDNLEKVRSRSVASESAKNLIRLGHAQRRTKNSGLTATEAGLSLMRAPKPN